jgi:1,4-alpha-glucan branching enzyme
MAKKQQTEDLDAPEVADAAAEAAPQAEPEPSRPSDGELAHIADGSHSGPHSVLGQHPAGLPEAWR